MLMLLSKVNEPTKYNNADNKEPPPPITLQQTELNTAQ